MRNMYDAVIVGGGPAGLSAAIYLGRAKYKVLVVEKEKIGGQIAITSDVANYPGIKQISGAELTDEMYAQAIKFGVEFVDAEVKALALEQQIKKMDTTKGSYQALSVILATGANPRKIGFIGEKNFKDMVFPIVQPVMANFFQGGMFLLSAGVLLLWKKVFF